MPNEIYVTEPVKGTGTGTGFYAQTDFDGSTKYIRADSIHADVAVAFGAIEKGLMSLSIEERDCYQSGFSSEGLRLADIGSQIGAALNTIRAALQAQLQVNQELLKALKKAADIFRDYERIHLSKNPPDRSKAERNGDYAYMVEQAIARAKQKGLQNGND